MGVCDLSGFIGFVVDMPCVEEDCIVFGRRVDIISKQYLLSDVGK